jgi:hypothetical protein
MARHTLEDSDRGGRRRSVVDLSADTTTSSEENVLVHRDPPARRTTHRVARCRRPGRGLGFHLGVAFQIRDDVLNLCGEEGEVGKEILGDLLEASAH